MTDRGRWLVAGLVAALALSIAAVYVLLFTTAWAGIAAGLFLAAASSAAIAFAPMLGARLGGQAEELELEPLQHPERYARKPPYDPVSLWLYGDEVRRIGRGDRS